MITGEQAKYLKLAIEQFKSGISKGSSQGFSTRMQITPSSALRSALEIPLHIISDPFASAKGGMREFDRDIKDAEYLGARPKGGGYNREDGKKAVRSKFNEILIQASNINSKYFKPFMSLIDTKWNGIGKTPTELGKNLGIGSVNDINSDLNIDISELNDLSSSYEETNNPSNMILLYILPTMRKKFSALQTFSGTDFNSMFDKAISEQLSSSEISEIMDLYRAALEWAMFVDSLKSSNPIESGIENIANESEFKMFLFYALGEESGRTIGSFDLNINHDIDEAHVVVQKPRKSEVFSLSASTSDIFLDENKIEYHRIHVNNYKKNLSKIFTFEYLNPGKVLTASSLQNNQSSQGIDNISNKPIRYSVPTWQPLTVLLLFFGGLGFLYSNQKNHSHNPKNRIEQSVNRKSRKKFCTECGSPVELKDKYCSNCGAKI